MQPPLALSEAFRLGLHVMTPMELVTPVILLAALAGVGAWSAGHDAASYWRLLRHGSMAAILLLIPGSVLVGWFVCFDPD